MDSRRLFLAVLVPAAIILGACQSDDAGESPEADSLASTSSGDPEKLFYLDGTALYSYTLATGRRSLLADLPSGDVAVAPNGEAFVVVEETAPGGAGGKFKRPVLRVAPLNAAGTLLTLGPGKSPVWSPDSAEVAAVATVKGYRTCPFDPREGAEKTVRASDCVTAERVIAYSATGENEPEVALGAGAGYSIVGWSADRRIVAVTSAESSYVVINSVGAAHEDREVVGFAPSEVWGTSPTNYTLLIVDDGGEVFFTSPGQGARPPMNDLNGVLGDGKWSPDGGRVAAALLQGDDRAPTSSRLVVLDVASNTTDAMPGSAGAQGNVVWSPDSLSFAYVRASKGNLEAVLCSTKNDCTSLFEWREGITLLGLG